MTTTSRSGNDIEQAINAILGSPWLWGTAVTLIFYAALPYAPLPPSVTQRFLSANWGETVLTGLFFIGSCQLITRLRQIPVERSVLSADLLGELSTERDEIAGRCAQKVESKLIDVGKHHLDTLLAKRVRETCQFVNSRGSTKGLEDHLRFLIQLGHDRVPRGSAMSRWVMRAIPVVGLVTALTSSTTTVANLTDQQVASSLSDMLAEIALAFDPLTLSLVYATTLALGKLFVEQLERHTFDEIDDVSLLRLPTLFPLPVEAASPFRLAEQQAADQLLSASERMVVAEVELWRRSLEELRDRWASTLANQQNSIDQMLKTGLTNALANHAQELIESRTEFLAAFRETSQSIDAQLAETRRALAEQQQSGCEQISHTWQHFHAELTKTRDEHARQLALLTQAITAEVGGWQNQLASSAQLMSHQFQELRSQGDVFLKLSDNESQLIRLENRLADNLDAMRVVEVLENTLMSLNAAVHLLTSRVKLNAA